LPLGALVAAGDASADFIDGGEERVEGRVE
jgi:hypothetical protein